MTTTALTPGVSYNATSLLGFGVQVPVAEPGTIAIQYDGWSLQDLRNKRQNLMWNQDWYDQCPWASEKLPSGIYVLRLPVPDSNRKAFAEQEALLLSGEEPAPIVLAATALLAIRLSGGSDPLKGQSVRCKEQAAAGNRALLRWSDGQLYVIHWNDDPYDDVWLASARKTSSEP